MVDRLNAEEEMYVAEMSSRKAAAKVASRAAKRAQDELAQSQRRIAQLEQGKEVG